VDPFYFGDRDRPLFGLYHPPAGPPFRDAAILLCYPIGHEQIVSHRAFTQLSMRLSAAGFPVLRFDFYGCGDSSGACEDGSPGRWLRDIAAAIGSLRLRSSCRTLAIVGCRFGATLAMLAGADREDIASMVLWDPIVNGAAYIEELSVRHREMLQRTHVVAGRPPAPDTAREFLGIALGKTAIDEMAAIDVLTLRRRPAPQVLVIDSDSSNSSARLRQHLITLGSSVEHQLLPVENAWTWIEDVNKVLVPQNVMAAIVSWIAQRRA
jgi:pimeloyl-ACP methyl ester carboxylesterase